VEESAASVFRVEELGPDDGESRLLGSVDAGLPNDMTLGPDNNLIHSH
jgi:hypothetical protein